MSETPDAPAVDERDNAESRSNETDRGPGVARAGGASVPPPAWDAKDQATDEGTAAGDPLAGVTISEEDAANAVPGDTGPEHPGERVS